MISRIATLKRNKYNYLALAICTLFFIAYAILGVVRHNNYQSFGFDLGINNQIVWEYSRFKSPITTIDHIVNVSKLTVHVEFIYLLLSPFYWIWSDARMLIILQSFFVCFSGFAVYLLAKQYKFQSLIQFALLFSYLLFYGVQNALWFDVHSTTFGTAFVMWFIYYLITEKKKYSFLFFLLAIFSKENYAGILFLISLVYFIISRKKIALIYMGVAIIYLYIIFGIYFPQFVEGGYRFDSKSGLLSSIDPLLMINTPDKLSVYYFTFGSFGFIPLFAPLFLIPVIGNLASYFILGREVDTAQGLFLQYRIELVSLISWGTIEAIKRFNFLNKKWIAIYLLVCILAVQYLLHLPLSYLTKKWFWTTPSGVGNINKMIKEIDPNASLAVQNNIIPHISTRDHIYTLYPDKKIFIKNSPCGKSTCNWFRWEYDPQYLLVDTSPEWDIRHYLSVREDYVSSITTMEKAGYIKKKKQIGSTVLYDIKRHPY